MYNQANDDKIALEAKPPYITLKVPFHYSVFKQENGGWEKSLAGLYGSAYDK